MQTKASGVLPLLTLHGSGRIPKRIGAAGAGEEGPSRTPSWIGWFLEVEMESGEQLGEVRSTGGELYL